MVSTLTVPNQQTAGQRNTWIFQASPKLYKITDSLRLENEEMWNLRQHHRHVRLGDRVLIWISGDRAGIYALGTVISNPVVQSDSPKGISYWNDKQQGFRPIARVRVRYERILLNHPLLRDFLSCDPDLWKLSILRNPRGTNFTVTVAEW